MEKVGGYLTSYSEETFIQKKQAGPFLTPFTNNLLGWCSCGHDSFPGNPVGLKLN